MNNDTSTIPGDDQENPAAAEVDTVHGLLCVWAWQETSRLGQFIPVAERGRVLSWGRGEESLLGLERAEWMEQRPGENVCAPPTATSHVSRDHLLLQPRVWGIEVECRGKNGMLVDGVRATTAALEEGAFLLVPDAFLFRCVKRPRVIPASRHLSDKFLGRFGEPTKFGTVCETPRGYEWLDRLAFAAKAAAHVLLLGETGSGKESSAAAIHMMSLFAPGPFVARSIADIHRNLIEDELFGHVKNYPQAGMDALEGLVARADAGVLFLDEIANLPPDAQGALLRVLDGGYYKPGGAKEFRHVLFRLVAAMNREEEVLQADLRKRLMIKVNVPNLAERRDDIPLILRHLLRKARAALKGDRAEESDLVKHMLVEQTDGSLEVVPPVAFVLELMRRPSFDGNVRDLESAMWDLFFRSAPPQVRAELDKPPRPGAAANEDERSLQLTAAEVQWCLRKTGGNVSAAAKLAGMSRPAFYRALERVGMKGERGRRG